LQCRRVELLLRLQRPVASFPHHEELST
jgi:hypothetical protein